MKEFADIALPLVAIINAMAVIYLSKRVSYYASKALLLDSMIHQLLHSKSMEEFEKKIIKDITDGDMQKRHE